MPSATNIIDGLTSIAQQHLHFAAAWHALVLIAFVALAVGVRPSHRVAAMILAAPLASVSLFAWLHGNPFNAGIFALLAASSALMGLRLRGAPSRPSRWLLVSGTAALAYAWVYPHFVSAPIALVASPMGLIPCPTLSLVLGFGALASGLSSRVWSLVFGGAGLFYAVFGVLVLGVWLDVGLMAFSLPLIVLGLVRHATPRFNAARSTTRRGSETARG